MSFAVFDFCIPCWVERCHIFNFIREKDLSVSWIKVKGHSGVYGNIRADFAAGAATRSQFFMPLKAFWSVVIFNESCLPPPTVRKRLYDKGYPGVFCLLCGEVKLFDHVFSCISDANIQKKILAGAFALWVSLLGPCFLTPSATLMFLDSCSSNVGLYSVLCKGFVMSDWCLEAIGAFKNKKRTADVVIDFVRGVVELYYTKVWLIRTKYRVNMERAGLVRNGELVSGLPCHVASALSDDMIRLLGILESFAVSFGHCQTCLFFFGLDFNLQVVIGV
ncbi:hypothetical protein G9A89_017916 [Geosiphon pyriformis]|nr:hypothetical protein G9A89_017916 [Geosiphon pyriformis]